MAKAKATAAKKPERKAASKSQGTDDGELSPEGLDQVVGGLTSFGGLAGKPTTIVGSSLFDDEDGPTQLPIP